MAKYDDDVAAYLREQYPMPAGVQRAANLASLDLYFGPLSGHDVPGDDPDYAPLVAAGVISGEAGSGDDRFTFSAALDLVSGYASNLPGTLYWEEDSGCVSESEPAGEEWDTGELNNDGAPILEWCDPMPYYQIDQPASTLFNAELCKML